jgi:hypothetical protein
VTSFHWFSIQTFWGDPSFGSSKENKVAPCGSGSATLETGGGNCGAKVGGGGLDKRGYFSMVILLVGGEIFFVAEGEGGIQVNGGCEDDIKLNKNVGKVRRPMKR